MLAVAASKDRAQGMDRAAFFPPKSSAMNEKETATAGALRAPPAPEPREIRFDRRELDQILRLYGVMVAQGEWRDYAISFTRDAAIFAIHRRTSEVPLYRIEKRPRLKERQGMYAVIAPGGQILKRGHDLAQVLKVFEKKRLALVQ